MFLDRLTNLCHAREHIVPNRSVEGFLSCTECGQTMNAYEYILNPPGDDPFLSIRLAHEYAEWIGGETRHVPCTFPLVGIPGILSKRVATHLDVLEKATGLLRELNAPFLVDHRPEYSKNIVSDFLREYVSVVQNLPTDTTESMAVKTLLANLNTVQELDLFEMYFEIAVPYVQKHATLPEKPKADEDEDVGLAFYRASQTATAIRTTFSKYCLLFDVAYVMVYCYVCGGTDPDAVANFTLDLVAKICNRYFIESPVYGPRVRDWLAKNIAYNKNTDSYYVAREIQRGNTLDGLSVDFLTRFEKLERLVTNHFRDDKFAVSQTFPYVLFPDDDDYYGFKVSLCYLVPQFHTKGSVGKAKRVYRFVKRFLSSLRHFEARYWTMEEFKLFLTSDERLGEDFRLVLETLMETQPRE